jgi:hypothetical protein
VCFFFLTEPIIKSGFSFSNFFLSENPEETAIHVISAALVALTPNVVSSTTTIKSELSFNLEAHLKNISGSGLGSGTSSAERTISKKPGQSTTI